MTRHHKVAGKLYLINLTLLATHEIDSAFWHEWKLFNLPGGIDFFLLVNFVLLTIFLIGFEKVTTWARCASTYSVLLALSGIFAFTIHTYYFQTGHPEFKSVISISILTLTFIISIAQLVLLVIINRQKAVK